MSLAALLDTLLADLPRGALWYLAATSAVIWLVGAGFITWSTRPRLPEPGPTADEFGAGSLALANFLVNRGALTPSAASGVVLDLAARRVLGIEEIGDGRQLVRYFPTRSSDVALAPAEAAVLDLVRRRLGEGQTVPVGELNLGADDAASNWWKTFSGHVVAEGRRLGLLRKRWPAGAQLLMAVTLLAPALLVALGIESHDAVARLAGDTSKGSELGGGFGIGFVAYAAVLALGASRLRAWVTTSQGDQVAARWLGARAFFAGQPGLAEAPPAAVVVRGRHLAAAVALGVAPVAAGRLPIGPQNDSVAWVQRGGLWRELPIRYPAGRQRNVGPELTMLLSAAISGLCLLGLYVYVWFLRNIVADLLRAVLDAGSLPFALRVGLPAFFIVVPTGFALFGGLTLYRAVLDLVAAIGDIGQSEEVVGPVLRVPTKIDDGHRVRTGYLAVDDGHSDEIVAVYCVKIDPAQGQRVRLVVSPKLRYVRHAELL